MEIFARDFERHSFGYASPPADIAGAIKYD
jgi:hypothetical protein